MKMLLFVVGSLVSAFLTLSATSNAAPLGDGFQGRGSRGGFASHRASMSFLTSSGIRPNSASRPTVPFNQERRFFRRDHRVVFQPLIWPAYWYLDGYPNDYSYLDDGPDDTYQYWDNSATAGQPESSSQANDQRPIIVILKNSDSQPARSTPDPGYSKSVSSSSDAAGQQRLVGQGSADNNGPRSDQTTVVPPAIAQPPQSVAKGTPTRPQGHGGAFGNFVLVSWLEEAGKDVIYVQNTETNEVQKITSEPNLDNFRIVKLHLNADPKLIEAVISNGSQEGSVRFRF